MISIAGSTCDFCYDVLVQLYTLYASGFVLGRLIWLFDPDFRFVAPGGLGRYYELQHDGIYTVSIVL